METSETRFAKVGEIVHIELEENPTTGYLWMPTWPDGLLVVANDYRSHQQRSPDPTLRDAPLVGGGGMRRIDVRADRPGSFEVVFALRQPWAEKTPVKVHRVEIIAGP